MRLTFQSKRPDFLLSLRDQTLERTVVEKGDTDIARCRWLTPVILATQEVQMRRIAIGKPAWSNSSQDISQK
jgi:hypothetical protein